VALCTAPSGSLSPDRDGQGSPAHFYAALGDHPGVIEAEHFGRVPTGIGGAPLTASSPPAMSGAAIQARGRILCAHADQDGQGCTGSCPIRSG
jgi:hypothetical protein